MKAEVECLNVAGSTGTFSHSLLDCKYLFCLNWKEMQQEELKDVGANAAEKMLNSIVSIKYAIFIAMIIIDGN